MKREDVPFSYFGPAKTEIREKIRSVAEAIYGKAEAYKDVSSDKEVRGLVREYGLGKEEEREAAAFAMAMHLNNFNVNKAASIRDSYFLQEEHDKLLRMSNILVGFLIR